jgi:hypothetical protein
MPMPWASNDLVAFSLQGLLELLLNPGPDQLIDIGTPGFDHDRNRLDLFSLCP